MKVKIRYWRVDVIHISGYHAPSIFVRSDELRLWKAEAQALAQAKERTPLSKYLKWALRPTLRNVYERNGTLYKL